MLIRQRKAVEEAASSLSTLQKVQGSTIRGLQSEVDQDQRHVDTAIQNIRRLPSGFVREIRLPSQFLHDAAHRSARRMHELKQRIDEVEQMLIPLVDGAGADADLTGDGHDVAAAGSWMAAAGGAGTGGSGSDGKDPYVLL